MIKHAAIVLAAGFASAANAGLASGNLETFADSNINGDAPASATTLGSGRTYTIRSGGVVSGATGIRFMPIEGAAAGSFAGWGLIEFDPTEALAQIQGEVDATAGATGFVITGATLTAQQQLDQPFSPANGALDIYHASDDATNPFSISGGSFTNQLGGASLVVDDYAYASSPGSVFEFTNAGEDYSAVLADWNDGTDLIRMMINPGDAGVVAPFKGSSSPFGGINAPSFRLTYDIVPTPGAASLFGLAGLAAARRRRK